MKKEKLSKLNLKNILSKYDIHNFSAKLIKKGVLNTSYKITSDKNYVLRIYKHKTFDEIKLELKIINKLKKTVPVPKIYKTNKKEEIISFNNKNICLFEFLKGEHISQDKVENIHIKDIAKKTAKMHKALKNYKPKNYNNKKAYNLDFIYNYMGELKKEKLLFKEFENFVLSVVNSINIIKLPKVLVHADIHLDNILFYKNKVSAILDFDDCFYGYKLIDVASTIRYACFDGKTINTKLIKEYIKSYEEELEFTNNEKKHFVDVLRMFNLIHFMFGLEDKTLNKDNFTSKNRYKFEMQAKELKLF